jgi:hypothetical protein
MYDKCVVSPVRQHDSSLYLLDKFRLSLVLGVYIKSWDMNLILLAYLFNIGQNLYEAQTELFYFLKTVLRAEY